MKLSRRRIGTAITCIAVTLASHLTVSAQTPSPRQALIVVRHGEDLDKWVTSPEGLTPEWKAIAPEWPKYSLPADTYKVSSASSEKISELTVFQHGLSPAGEAQAVVLHDYLPELLIHLKLAPISKVVTKRPSVASATPNPFDTVYPLLKDGFAGKVLLITPEVNPKNPSVDLGLANMLPKFKDTPPNPGLLLEGTGSTLLCWDAEGLWGAEKIKDSKGNEIRVWNPKSILAKLGAPLIGDEIERATSKMGGGVPAKGARLYIFVRRDIKTSSIDGYDCTVLDIIPNPNDPKTKAFVERAIITIDSNGKMTEEHPNAVFDHLTEEASAAK